MENKQDNGSIRDQVLDAVKAGRIKMRPKWHFVLRAALLIVGVAAVAITILYLASLFVFIVRQTGVWAAPSFGMRGLLIFLASVPWVLILLVLLFVLIMEILVRHYEFAYRSPLLYSVLGILAIVGIGGLLVAATPLHHMLSHCPPGPSLLSANGQFPPPPCGSGVYRDLAPQRFKDFFRGTISEVGTNSLTIEDFHGDNQRILISPKTRLPLGEDFTVGDNVIIVGDRIDDTIQAFGIRVIDK